MFIVTAGCLWVLCRFICCLEVVMAKLALSLSVVTFAAVLLQLSQYMTCGASLVGDDDSTACSCDIGGIEELMAGL